MKRETLFFVCFVTSIITIVPLLEPAHEFTVKPNIEGSVVYNVHTPSIKIIASVNSLIKINVTFLNLNKESSSPILSQHEFKSTVTVDTDQPGYYLIEILSSEISKVKIEGSGIYFVNIVLIIALGLINIYYVYKKTTKIQ